MRFKALRYSMLASYQKCRRAFKYQYVEGLVSRSTPRPLVLGTMVHKVLEIRLRGGTVEAAQAELEAMAAQAEAEEVYFDDEGEMTSYAALVDIASSIGNRAFKEFDKFFYVATDKDGEPIIERTMHGKIPGVASPLRGTCDLICVERATGAYWLGDWKIRKDMGQEDDEQWNGQMPTYHWLAQQNFDFQIRGTIIFGVLAKVPRKPAKTKDGGVSRANVITDWPTYRAAVVEAGQDPLDYDDMRVKLEGREWFKQHRIWRSQIELAKTVEYAVFDVARQITRDTGKVAPPNLTRMCKGCSYKDLCLEENKGADTKYTKTIDFERSNNECHQLL